VDLLTDAARRVAVVDDHRSFADLLALALEGQRDLRHVGHATTAATARDLLRRNRPDVVLMDVELPDGDGISLTREVRDAWPDTDVVVLTSHNNLRLASRAVAAGAGAFFAKDGSLADLLRVLRKVGRGPVTVVAPGAGGSSASTGERPPVRLTTRELDTLTLLAQGCDIAVAAARMGVTVHTCRGYVKSLYAKLGVHSRVEALLAGVERGLVEVGRHPRPAPR
jgi:DNA-binding NarL/FixJ family response regulator